MREKEYMEYIKKTVLMAEQEAMKEKLNATGSDADSIRAKADGVLALSKILRETIDDYNEGKEVSKTVSDKPLDGLYIAEELPIA